MRSVCCMLLCAVASGCGGGPVDDPATRVLDRRTVLWVDQAIDEDLSASLSRVGVSMLVVRRGSIGADTGAPVLRISRPPAIAGDIPVAAALRMAAKRAEIDPRIADSLWQTLARELGGTPAELILDLPVLPKGTGEFISRLSAQSGLVVTPILTVDQLRTEAGIEVAKAAGVCVVPTYGPEISWVRGPEQMATRTLRERLAPLVGSGVTVRLAVVLHPVVEPKLDHWGEGLGPLCADDAAEISPHATQGRSFVLRRGLEWSRRQWGAGDTINVRWMDAARLHSALAEIGRLALPDVGGWDLVSLPPAGNALGLGREGLVAYLGGRGPGPEVTVESGVSGRNLRVSLENFGPFSSAVSSGGHWLEISVPGASVSARDAGDFEHLTLGSRRTGEWKSGIDGGVDAVRFGFTFLGPGEKVRTGSIRLPSSGARVRISWHLSLSNGEVVSGSTTR